MVCGNADISEKYGWPEFAYRTGGDIVDFFRDCELETSPFCGARLDWAIDEIRMHNEKPALEDRLPSEEIVAIIRELAESAESKVGLEAVLGVLNSVLRRDRLKVIQGADQQFYILPIENDQPTRATILAQMTPEQRALRKRLEDFLDKATEDEFLENLMRPMLQQLGFRAVKVTGHRDKALEYGKDLWFKMEIPTQHFLYFGLQAKKGRIHAAREPNKNVAEVLTQVRMLLDYPIFDAETNIEVLVDHAIIAATGNITKQAQNYLGRNLSQDQRRHILFMDREHLLNLCLLKNLPPP